MAQTNIRYKIFTDLQKLDDIESFWKKNQIHPYHDFQYYQLCASVEKDFISPYMVAIYKNDVIEALLVGTIRNKKISYRFGYKKIFSHQVPTLAVAYRGYFGNLSDEIIETMLRALNRGMKDKMFDQIAFDHLNRESRFFHAVQRFSPIWRRDWTPYKNPHWYAQIPDSYDEFYQKLSKNTKGTVRQYRNRLVREFGDKIDFRVYSQKSEVKAAMDDIESVAQLTYHRRLGAGFMNDEETGIKWAHWAERKNLQMAVLYLENKPAAFWNWIIYRGSCLSVNTGYRPELAYYHAGFYVMMEMIRRFCEMPDCKTLDFGFGDAQYKRKLGDEKITETSISLFAPNFSGFKLQLLKNSTDNSSQQLKLLLEKMALDQKIKRLWRKKLVQKKD
ncbi:MAG: GNAT family N-acetyltransferase [Calditrichaeota bacterium]|nr:GNAT family N-acetyltransferase [Calditrichota bacterium]